MVLRLQIENLIQMVNVHVHQLQFYQLDIYSLLCVHGSLIYNGQDVYELNERACKFKVD